MRKFSKLLVLWAISPLLFSLAQDAQGETKTFVISDFNKIKASGSLDIELSQGEKSSVVATAESAVFEHIVIEVIGDTLTIAKKSSGLFSTCPSDCDLSLKIQVKDLKTIDLSGAVGLVGTKLNLKELDLLLSGAADIELSGSAKSLSLNASGAADIDCSNLKSEIVTVKTQGSVDAEVYATKVLEVKVSGSGDVHYLGNPAKVISRVSGSASIGPKG